MENKYEHLKFLIERFDNSYDSINNKGSFYIGLNTFILGGIFVGFLNLKDKIGSDICIWILLALLTLATYLSIVFTIQAMKPFTKDNFVNDDNHSLVYFGGISKYQVSHFIQKINTLSSERVIEDMTRQVHCLANGLHYKFGQLKKASILLLVQFFLILPLIFLTLIKII